MPGTRIQRTSAGSGCAGHLVQLGTVAVFHARLAGKNRGVRKILSDQPADHRLRHFIFLGGAHDHAGYAHDRGNSLPGRLLALAGADDQRREDVQVQRHGPGSSEAESTVWNGRDALLPGVDGGSGNGHYSVR